MNSIPKIRSIVVFCFLFLIISCSNIESEKTYCEKQAKNYFFLCLLNVAGSPTYFGKPELASAEVQTYSTAFCIAEYNRKLKCPDKKSYKPHRKD